MSQNILDVSFPIVGAADIPSEHGSPLHGALSKLYPEQFHGTGACGVHPISGRQIGGRRMRLTKDSCLRLRVSDSDIQQLIGLTSKTLEIAGSQVFLGAPTIFPLTPSPALKCRLLTIKLKKLSDKEEFIASLKRKLAAINVSDGIYIEVGNQHTVHIHRREILGYRVQLKGLSNEDSVVIQASDIWSRRALGCGIFVPCSKETR